ncbi:hypothetical protein DFH09DRAFT_1359202 [Mycena vulgaris]|nr:hypothetical protein DFH09DRAFT_1359202 [Mycena vulgaris]
MEDGAPDIDQSTMRQHGPRLPVFRTRFHPADAAPCRSSVRSFAALPPPPIVPLSNQFRLGASRGPGTKRRQRLAAIPPLLTCGTLSLAQRPRGRQCLQRTRARARMTLLPTLPPALRCDGAEPAERHPHTRPSQVLSSLRPRPTHTGSKTSSRCAPIKAQALGSSVPGAWIQRRPWPPHARTAAAVAEGPPAHLAVYAPPEHCMVKEGALLHKRTLSIERAQVPARRVSRQISRRGETNES